ncbi:unnamed protein product, partial [Ectocarpus fasciculatus]
NTTPVKTGKKKIIEKKTGTGHITYSLLNQPWGDGPNKTTKTGKSRPELLSWRQAGALLSLRQVPYTLTCGWRNKESQNDRRQQSVRVLRHLNSLSFAPPPKNDETM